MTRLFDQDINEQDIKDILSENVNEREQVKDDLTPIQYHAYNGHWKLVEAFAPFSVDKSQEKNAKYGYALVKCIENNQLEIAKKLLAAGARSTGFWGTYLKPDMRVTIAETLLDQLGVSINWFTINNQACVPFEPTNLLDFAISLGNERFFQKVLNLNADLTLRNATNNTPIIAAAKQKRWNYVAILLNKMGASDINDSFGYKTVIELAKADNNEEIVTATTALLSTLSWETITASELKTLLQNSPTIRFQQIDGLYPIQMVANLGKKELVKVFAEFKLPKDTPYNLGKDAGYGKVMHQYAKEGDLELAVQLLQANAYAKAKDADGMSLLQRAVTTNDAAFLEAICDSPTAFEYCLRDASGPDQNYQSPMLLAAKNGKWDLVDVFTQKMGPENISYLEDSNPYQQSRLTLYKQVINCAPAGEKRAAVMKSLIDFSKMEQRSRFGLTPMNEAISRNDAETLRLMTVYPSIYDPAYYDYSKDTAGLVDAYKKLKDETHARLYEQVPNLSEVMQHVQNHLKNEDRKEKWGDKPSKEIFKEEFRKIYAALYESQSSLYKTGKLWHLFGTIKESEIRAYAVSNPNSRTAIAIKMTDEFINSLDKKALVRGIHAYSYEHSSTFGFFKQSKREKGLAVDFDTTYDAVNDTESRTGIIKKYIK